MNCYTVVEGKVHVGIALTQEERKRGHLYLSLGKKTGQAGVQKSIILAPSDPASYVLMAGGIHLMRTANLLQKGEKENAEFVLAKAKYGLKADSTDRRALVLVDFTSHSSSAGYIPSTYENIPIHGFEVLEVRGFADSLYRVQALVILQPGQHFHYHDKGAGISYAVAYDFDEKQDHFPKLSCVLNQEYRMRESKKFVTV